MIIFIDQFKRDLLKFNLFGLAYNICSLCKTPVGMYVFSKKRYINTHSRFH